MEEVLRRMNRSLSLRKAGILLTPLFLTLAFSSKYEPPSLENAYPDSLIAPQTEWKEFEEHFKHLLSFPQLSDFRMGAYPSRSCLFAWGDI